MNRPRIFTRAALRDNPVAVMLVGLCPAAAVTVRVIDALWMSLGLLFVLVLTRLSQAILRGVAGSSSGTSPQGARAPSSRGGAWIGSLVLASCFTACFELLLRAFAPEEGVRLGIYVPLLAVNCIVLERFPRTAPDQGERSPGRDIALSLQGAAGLGVGFAACLVAISLVRECLGSGTITLFPAGSFGGTIAVGSLSAAPVRALAYAAGGLLSLGYLAGAARLLRGPRREPPA